MWDYKCVYLGLLPVPVNPLNHSFHDITKYIPHDAYARNHDQYIDLVISVCLSLSLSLSLSPFHLKEIVVGKFMGEKQLTLSRAKLPFHHFMVLLGS